MSKQQQKEKNKCSVLCRLHPRDFFNIFYKNRKTKKKFSWCEIQTKTRNKQKKNYTF